MHVTKSILRTSNKRTLNLNIVNTRQTLDLKFNVYRSAHTSKVDSRPMEKKILGLNQKPIITNDPELLPVIVQAGMISKPLSLPLVDCFRWHRSVMLYLTLLFVSLHPSNRLWQTPIIPSSNIVLVQCLCLLTYVVCPPLRLLEKASETNFLLSLLFSQNLKRLSQNDTPGDVWMQMFW